MPYTVFRSTAIVLLANLTLIACGGGGGVTSMTERPTPENTPKLFDRVSTESAELAVAVLDSAARTTRTETGTLDRADDRATTGDLTGDLSANRQLITLDGGGSITLVPGDTGYASRFIATPAGEDRTIGILGIATQENNLPTGSASYSGDANVTIQDGATLFDLSGTSSIEADFAAGSVTTTLSGLDGTRTEDLDAPVNVTDAATIEVSESALNGGIFSGGTASVSGSGLASLSDSAMTSLTGSIFGPKGEEAGGVLVIDDRASGRLQVFGDFVGK